MGDNRRSASSGAHVQGAPARRALKQGRSVSSARESVVHSTANASAPAAAPAAAPAPSPALVPAPRRMQASPARSTLRRERGFAVSPEMSQLLSSPPTLQFRSGKPRRGNYSQSSPHRTLSEALLPPSQLQELSPESEREWWRESTTSVPPPPPPEHTRASTRLAAFRRKLIMSLWPARIMFMTMGCVAMAFMYELKLNITASIDLMVNHTALGLNNTTRNEKGLFSCPNVYIYKDGPFLWDEITQRMLSNGYLYGYIGSQIPAAIFAERFGGKWIVFSSVMVNGLCCVLTPTTALNAKWDMLLLLLMVQGAAGGLILPAITTMISHWAPLKYRSTFCGVIYGGMALGKVVTVMMSYLMYERGWESRFHFLVLMLLPWSAIWGLWVHSTPVNSFYIIPRVIDRRNDRASGTTIVPLRDPGIAQFPLLEVKNSMSFWALVVANFGGGCGFFMVMTQIPRFVRQIQTLTLAQNVGFYILPYLLMFLVSVVLGVTIDYLRRKHVSLEILRKCAAAIAMLIPAGCFIGMSFTGCDSIVGTVLFMVAVTAVGAESVSYLANHIDISPNLASTLMAITGIFATLPHIIIPIVLSYSPVERESPDKSFYIIATIYITTFVFFAMFASGNVQPWNNLSK